MPLPESFVQVEAGLPHSRLVDRLRADLGVTREAAIGHLVQLWIAVLAIGKHGQIGDRSDLWIEDAAGWRGEAGAFAKIIRDMHLDSSGTVKDWDEKYGKLEATRERWRVGKAEQRSGKPTAKVSRGQSARQSSGQSSGHPHGQREDTSISLSLSGSTQNREKQRAVVGSEEKEAATYEQLTRLDAQNAKLRQLVQWVTERFPAPAVESVVGFIRSSRSPNAVVSVLQLHLDGELAHEQATGEELARAIVSYAANEAGDRFNSALFAGYVKRVKRQAIRAEGRVKLDREQQTIDRERQEIEAERERVSAEERQVAAFERDHPERFAELHALADKQVPKDLKMGRATIVRSTLIRLVIDELRRAS